MEGGGLRVEGGELRVEGGGWRVEGGGWRVEGGGWRVEGCVRRCGAFPGARASRGHARHVRGPLDLGADFFVLVQRLPEGAGDLFVTLNPPNPPAKDKTIRRLSLAHPVFSDSSRAAQERLPSVNGQVKP